MRQLNLLNKPMEHRTTAKPAGLARLDNGLSRISGYAAVFYRADDPETEYPLGGKLTERIGGGAFDRNLEQRRDVLAYYNHNPDALLGRTSNGTLRLWKDAVGLRYEVDIDEQDPDHQRVVAKLQRGDLNGSSFGFQIRNYDDTSEGGRIIRTLTDVELIEVGPQTMPAYAGTSSEARSLDHDTVARRLRLLDLDDQKLRGA